MKKSLFLVCIVVLFATNAFAQKARSKARKPVKKATTTTPAVVATPAQTALDAHPLAGNASVAMDDARGTLKKESPYQTNTKGEKFYQDTYTLTLKAGELLLLEYASEQFRVGLRIQTPEKQMITAQDTAEFVGISVLQYQYEAKTSGVHTLYLTTADPLRKGEYSVRKFILPATERPPSTTADFCEKVSYVSAHNQMRFSRLRGKKLRMEKKTGITEYYASAFEFMPSTSTELVEDTVLDNTKFVATLGEFKTKEAAMPLYTEYIAKLKACTPTWQHDQHSAETFIETSASTYTDFITIRLVTLGKKKFQVVLGAD